MFKNKYIKEILEKYKNIASLESLSSLASWDLSTYMPENAAKDRGFVLGKIEVLIKNFLLDRDFLKLINQAEKSKNLNDYERGVLRVLKKRIDFYKKLPSEFIEKFNQLTNQAQVVWKKAKTENDFNLFRPYLEKIVDLVKKQADYLGYQKHPYDALIDLYEEEWTVTDFENFFNSIKDPLKEILKKIYSAKNYKSKHPLEKEKYKKEDMEKVNYEVLKILNFDSKRSRLDVAPHPFEDAISLNDVRITTWYHPQDFRRSLSAVIHEFGHSLYELNINPKLQFTPLQRGVSYGIHESQSRFWENMIGRNREFLKKIWPICKKHLSFLKKYSFEDFFYYFNLVRSELIRVEADEVTYHFHIILRFEIEKGLLEEKLKVKDLPDIWNEKMKNYLGIVPKTYSEGVLQDIHWSLGYFGYFPTYSLGTFVSGLWLQSLEKDLGKIENILKEKDGILKIQLWLKNKIHQFGKTYSSKELIKRVSKTDFTPEPFLNYLQQKYSLIFK